VAIPTDRGVKILDMKYEIGIVCPVSAEGTPIATERTGRNTTDPNAVRFVVLMSDETRSDYVICGRQSPCVCPAVAQAKV
jgi:hypothetical protein